MLSRQPPAETIVDNRGQKRAREDVSKSYNLRSMSPRHVVIHDTVRGTSEDLVNNASRLDGKNYPAYHDLLGNPNLVHPFYHFHTVQVCGNTQMAFYISSIFKPIHMPHQADFDSSLSMKLLGFLETFSRIWPGMLSQVHKSVSACLNVSSASAYSGLSRCAIT